MTASSATHHGPSLILLLHSHSFAQRPASTQPTDSKYESGAVLDYLDDGLDAKYAITAAAAAQPAAPPKEEEVVVVAAPPVVPEEVVVVGPAASQNGGVAVEALKMVSRLME